jgi:hypothetical protein
MTKYLIIGDIHGVFYKLQQFEHLFQTVDKVIFCGDYVDRGPQQLDVLTYILNIPNATLLSGNHEWKYFKKIKKGHKPHPKEIPPEKADEFCELLVKVVGERSVFCYKDENLGVSHAPAAYWQHDWNLVPFDKFAYGWSVPNEKDEKGFPKRIPLHEKYPGEVSQKPVIFGHIHSDKIEIGENLYCVDLKCGEENGRLGGVIFENSTLVDKIEI